MPVVVTPASALVLLTPHNTLGIIYYTLIKEMMNDGLTTDSQTQMRMGSFTSVLLMVLLLSIGFEYY